jgi:uncharacterized protein (TIGR03067 family)
VAFNSVYFEETCFDGDRVMAVYIGDRKSTTTVRSALAINHAVLKIIKLGDQLKAVLSVREQQEGAPSAVKARPARWTASSRWTSQISVSLLRCDRSSERPTEACLAVGGAIACFQNGGRPMSAARALLLEILMRTVSGLLLALLVIASAALAEDTKEKEKAKPVPKALQAAWMVEGWSHLNSTTVSTALPMPGRGLTITGNKAKWTAMEGALKAGEGTVSVDATTKPPRIELKTDKATYKGVYSLEKGFLLITFSAPGSDYPKKPTLDVDQKKEFTITFYHPDRFKKSPTKDKADKK